jgi:hypothetical protein
MFSVFSPPLIGRRYHRPRDTPESKFFFLQWDNEDFIINAVPHFLHLFLNLAKANEDFLVIILAADVLGLMRPFLEIELRGHTEIQMASHYGDLLTVYDPPDFAVLALIKERGLENLLPAPSAQDKVRYAFVYRRDLLCRAFNVFMGRGDHRPFPSFGILIGMTCPAELRKVIMLSCGSSREGGFGRKCADGGGSAGCLLFSAVLLVELHMRETFRAR